MVKRKRKSKGIFGSKFDFWDVFIILAIVGSGYFVYSIKGIEGILEALANGVFYGLIVGFVVRWIFRRARK